MNTNPGRSSAAAMVFLSMVMRMYCGMATDFSAARNAVWLCPLVGLVLSLPFALLLKQAPGCGNSAPWTILTSNVSRWLKTIIAVGFSMLLLYDCAVFTRLTASTANFISLNDVSLFWLILPLALMIAIIMRLGPDAEGNSARIWLKLLPLLLIIVVCVQLDSYNPAWLSPVLGGGLPGILQGGLLCGGWMALLQLSMACAVPDREKYHPVRAVFLSAVAASLLLMLLQMLCPAMVETSLSQMARIEIILNNNRVSHILQILMTTIWFIGLLHLISIEAVTAAVLIRDSLPKCSAWTVSSAGAAIVFVLSMSDWVRGSIADRFDRYLYIFVGGVMALLGLTLLKKRGECINEDR